MKKKKKKKEEEEKEKKEKQSVNHPNNPNNQKERTTKRSKQASKANKREEKKPLCATERKKKKRWANIKIRLGKLAKGHLSQFAFVVFACSFACFSWTAMAGYMGESEKSHVAVCVAT